MSKAMTLKELTDYRDNLKEQIADLDKKYFKAFAPKGYGHGTSYNDYDTIHGSRKELHIENYAEERERLQALLDLTNRIINLKLMQVPNENEYLSGLPTVADKIRYLRKVQRYTQAETAEKLGISTSTVRRVEKKGKGLRIC